jgi:myxalamid-type polyketide synthase MxaB
LLQYTSGSTADPKGVIVTHENLLVNQAMIAEALGTDSETVYVNWLPLFHDMGLLGAITSAVYIGCRSFHMAPAAFLQKPIRWLEAISRYEGTVTAAPNFAYDLCARIAKADDCEGLNLSSLKAALNAAEPVRAETLDRFTAVFGPYGFRPEHFAPTYGLAEATLFATGGWTPGRPLLQSVSGPALTKGEAVPMSAHAPEARTLVACGEVDKASGVRIVDPESFVECEPGLIGEIWVQGPHVSPGYWNNPKQTLVTFGAELAGSGERPFLRTGDLGVILDSHLYITGRLKDLIIIRGRNHFPQDIEHTVERSHPAFQIGSGAAFGLDMGSEEHLVVAQEVKREYRHNLNVNEIAATVRREIAREHGLSLAGLLLVRPLGISKTTSGKIRRLANREAYIDGTLKVLGKWLSDCLVNDGEGDCSETTMIYSMPFQISGDSAVNVAQISDWILWRISRLPEVPEHQLDFKRPFTDYGLDSLVSIQLISELADWLDRPMEIAILWDLPTIGALIDYLVADMHRDMLNYSFADHGGASGPKRQISPEEASRLLDKIEDLSESEIDELLAILEVEEPMSDEG